MKIYHSLIACSIFFGSISSVMAQFVPRTSITKAEFVIYGIYTSADPTCGTGLVATLPLTATGRTIDFSKKAAIGKTSGFSTEINCIAIVMKSGIDIDVAAGSHNAGTACDNGTTTVDADYNVSDGSQITWPAQIESDATAAGLTLMESGTSTPNSVVPIFLSTNSTCSTDLGPGSACPDFPSGFIRPLATSASNGFKLDPISPGRSYNFIFDLNNVVGDQNEDGTVCGIAGPPRITFVPR